MKDVQCVAFLQWALPRLHMRWAGFRKVRGQVCKRIGRRARELGLAGIEAYRQHIEEHADEWARLDALCRITISRFCRDHGVFEALARDVLPSLVGTLRERGDSTLRVWSAGCGSGEEPYTLSILWAIELQGRFPDVAIEIVGTDADRAVLERARDACFEFASLRSLPVDWREQAFSRDGDTYRLRPEFRRNIAFLAQDIRETSPQGRFDVVLCRNLAFTYFDEEMQFHVLTRILGVLYDGAALVVGAHEEPPAAVRDLEPWLDKERIYRKMGRTDRNP
jgi:chemotaxis protein methyltransferase CheR